MKKTEIFIKEYCQKLSDEHIKNLYNRLNQRMSGDLADVLDFLSNTREVDRWLSSAQGCIDLYDMIDAVADAVNAELNRRNVSVSA